MYFLEGSDNDTQNYIKAGNSFGYTKGIVGWNPTPVEWKSIDCIGHSGCTVH